MAIEREDKEPDKLGLELSLALSPNKLNVVTMTWTNESPQIKVMERMDSCDMAGREGSQLMSLDGEDCAQINTNPTAIIIHKSESIAITEHQSQRDTSLPAQHLHVPNTHLSSAPITAALMNQQRPYLHWANGNSTAGKSYC